MVGFGYDGAIGDLGGGYSPAGGGAVYKNYGEQHVADIGLDQSPDVFELRFFW